MRKEKNDNTKHAKDVHLKPTTSLMTSPRLCPLMSSTSCLDQSSLSFSMWNYMTVELTTSGTGFDLELSSVSEPFRKTICLWTLEISLDLELLKKSPWIRYDSLLFSYEVSGLCHCSSSARFLSFLKSVFYSSDILFSPVFWLSVMIMGENCQCLMNSWGRSEISFQL